MRTILFGLLLAATVLPLRAQEDLRAQCEQFAIEDGIPAEEKEQYMKECMGEAPLSGEAQEPAQQGGATATPANGPQGK